MEYTSNIKTGAPLVSIVVLAYNHLDYTMKCIESLFKYTSDVDYELITVNNGSSDGTEYYFNSLPNAKKINFPENIGVDKAVNYGFREAEGKYTINLSNDIVVTSNWLKNLVTCMESDPKIGMVVPVCNASSNYQQISLPYTDLDEMQEIAKIYNKSNPGLWEERMKLVTYTCLFRTDLQKAFGGFDEDFNPGAYDDDAMSFRVRRAGYKLILAGDTFVHHFGSVTFNEEYVKSNIAERNMRLFYDKFGVHSWNVGMIDFNIVNLAKFREKKDIKVLGIGQSYGASLLQIKNKFRKTGLRDVKLFYLSENEKSIPDLNTICEDCIYAPAETAKEFFGSRKYDIIVFENEPDKLINPELFFEDITDLLKEDGMLITTAIPSVYPRIESCLYNKDFAVTKKEKDYYFAFEKK